MYPDPFGGEPEPDLTNLDTLIDELERQAALLTAVATGGPRSTTSKAIPGSPSASRRERSSAGGLSTPSRGRTCGSGTGTGPPTSRGMRHGGQRSASLSLPSSRRSSGSAAASRSAIRAAAADVGRSRREAGRALGRARRRVGDTRRRPRLRRGITEHDQGAAGAADAWRASAADRSQGPQPPDHAVGGRILHPHRGTLSHDDIIGVPRLLLAWPVRGRAAAVIAVSAGTGR